MPYVEPLSDTRTQVGEMRVAARPGWAGEKDGSFKILMKNHGLTAVVSIVSCFPRAASRLPALTPILPDGELSLD